MIWGLKSNSWFECPHKIRLDVFMSAFAIDFAKAGVRVRVYEFKLTSN